MSSIDNLTDLQKQEWMDMTKIFSPLNPNSRMNSEHFYGLISSIDRIATETFKKMWKSHKEELIEEEHIAIAIEESKKNVVVDNKEEEEEEEYTKEEYEEYISYIKKEYEKIVQTLQNRINRLEKQNNRLEKENDILEKENDILEKEKERLLECRAKYRIEVYELGNLVENLIKEKKKN